MRKALLVLVAAVALAFSAIPLVQGQSSAQVQSIYPLTRDLGAIQTLTAQVAATVNSSDQNGFNVSRVVCALRTASHVGSPTATIAIQNKDAASGQYYSLVTSGSISSDTTTAVSAGSGVATTANISAGVPVAKTWRTQVVVGGTTSFTGTVGCSVQ